MLEHEEIAGHWAAASTFTFYTEESKLINSSVRQTSAKKSHQIGWQGPSIMNPSGGHLPAPWSFAGIYMYPPPPTLPPVGIVFQGFRLMLTSTPRRGKRPNSRTGTNTRIGQENMKIALPSPSRAPMTCTSHESQMIRSLDIHRQDRDEKWRSMQRKGKNRKPTSRSLPKLPSCSRSTRPSRTANSNAGCLVSHAIRMLHSTF